MNELLRLLFFRGIIRFIGKHVRFYWYKISGKPRSLKSLSNVIKNDYNDLGTALKQDFYNAFVGAFILIGVILIIAYITFG